MAIFLFVYGSQYYSVRIGFTGQRPLVYAIYKYDNPDQLPFIQGQTYRSITLDQYEWLLEHLNCDVSFVTGTWLGRLGNLECRTHGAYYHLFETDLIIPDFWEEREV